MGKQLEGDMEAFPKGMTFEPRPELHEETSHERTGRKRMLCALGSLQGSLHKFSPHFLDQNLVLGHA